jgi:hypothetical protein
MGAHEAPRLCNGDTWIEAESFCYPGGGMHRRARALCPDGKLRIIRCGIPDTFFTVPCKGGGYLTNDTTGVLVFNPRPKPSTEASNG